MDEKMTKELLKEIVTEEASKLSWHNDLNWMLEAFQTEESQKSKEYARIAMLADRPHYVFGGETWKRFWGDILDREVIIESINSFYENLYEDFLSEYGEQLETKKPVFLIVNVEELESDTLYPIVITVPNHEPVIFVVINESPEYKIQM